MNLGDLKFSEDDFSLVCDCIAMSENESHESTCSANQAAAVANYVLIKKLEKAPEVLHTWFEGFEFWSEDGTGSEPEHTARLVCIEEIKDGV